MALTYASKLAAQLSNTCSKERVFTGGVLKEPLVGSATPVDIREQLRIIGIVPRNDVQTLVAGLTEVNASTTLTNRQLYSGRGRLTAA
jgi:hypothetical protein